MMIFFGARRPGGPGPRRRRGRPGALAREVLEYTYTT